MKSQKATCENETSPLNGAPTPPSRPRGALSSAYSCRRGNLNTIFQPPVDARKGQCEDYPFEMAQDLIAAAQKMVDALARIASTPQHRIS